MAVGAAVSVLGVIQRRRLQRAVADKSDRLMAVTRRYFRRRRLWRPDLTRWTDEELLTAHLFDPDEAAYRDAMERRGGLRTVVGAVSRRALA